MNDLPRIPSSRIAGALRVGVCLVLVLAASRVHAQLVIQEGIPLEKLVREHFIGAGAQIGNLTYRGFPRSISYFNGMNSNIGINEGILLTSGWVGYAVGPNSVDDITYAAGFPGDADLAGLVGAFTFDACVLEFDFVPYQDSVTFEYVFGSDEYTEYVGSKFNDVFAFFISGPGIAGKQNIALIPGTNIPVSINNVNHNLNVDHYVNNYLGGTVEYDGFTKVLKAKAVVTPCETYRLKIAISDVMDPFFDSGVFLKAGSFDAGDALSVIGIRDAYENGCQPGLIEILRGGNLDKPLTVNFHVRGSATNGTDYANIATTAVFQPGQDTYVIPIVAINDGIADNGEWVTIYIEDLCQTGLVRDSIRIYETAPLSVQVTGDTVLCAGTSIELSAVVTGGSGVTRMQWDDDSLSTVPRIIVRPTTDRVYHFTVIDSLTGCAHADSVRIQIEALPEVDAGPDRFICPGETTSIGTPVVGSAGPYTVTWSPAIGLSDPASDVTIAAPPSTTTYVLRVRSVTGCEVTDTVTVTVSDFRFEAGPDTLICYGDEVQIGREAEKGRAPYTYEWTPVAGLSNPRVATPRASPEITTTYRVIARSDDGCVAEDSVTVTVHRIVFDAGPDRSICRGSTVLIGDTAVSAAPPLRYTWSPAIGLDDPWSPTPTAGPANSTVYTVTVTDARGCATFDTVRVVVNDVEAEAGANVAICAGDSVRLEGSVRRGQNPFTYSWLPTAGLSDPTVRNPQASPATSTWYVLTVIDGNGCVDRDSMLVTVWPEMDMNIRIEGSAVLCRGDSAVLDAGPGYRSYQWSTGETTQRITVRSAGSYHVEGTSVDGCPVRPDTLNIDVIDRPAPVITGPLTVCAGDSVRFSVAEVPGSVYLWQVFGGFILDGNDTHSVGVRWDVPGSYRVAIEQIFGSAVCRGDTAITVTVLPAPAPVITVTGPVSFCAGDSVRLDAPAGFDSYSWSSGETTASIIVHRSGRYHVTVRNAIGCAGTSPPIDVNVFPLPTPEIVALTPMPVCEGETVRLGLTQAYASYEWSGGQRSAEITVDTPGVFTVRVRSADGCEAESDTFAVTILPLPHPVIVADGPLEFCEGDSVRLTTTEPYPSYSWTNGDSARAVTIRASGAYSVRVRGTGGCEAESEILNVLVHPLPPPPVITRPQRLLESTPALSWQWYREENGALVPIAGATTRTYPGEAGVWYRVRVWDEHGCSAISEPFRFDETLEVASTVMLPTIETAPGEDVHITLRMPAQQNLLLAGVTRFEARIRFNASMLVPVGATPVGAVLAGERVIPLAGPFLPDSDVLAQLQFLAVLGNAAETPLVIEYFAWDQPDVAITRIDGLLRMTVCEEGGERLFDADGRIALEPSHPNPFNTTTTLTYEVIERGYTELFVLDMLGRRVARLVEGVIEPGRYRVHFEAGALASGLYLAVLRTPTVQRMQHLRLVK